MGFKSGELAPRDANAPPPEQRRVANWVPPVFGIRIHPPCYALGSSRSIKIPSERPAILMICPAVAPPKLSETLNNSDQPRRPTNARQ